MIILPLEGLINIDEEIARLQKEFDKLTKEVERVQTAIRCRTASRFAV
jgi:valyl-tRNA synthetase